MTRSVASAISPKRTSTITAKMGVDFADISVLKALGVHNIPPMIGRGVTIDMGKHRGKSVLDSGKSFGPDDIKAAAKAQGGEIRQGNVVLFHTRWTDPMLQSDPRPGFLANLLSTMLQQYISRGIT